MTGKKQRRQRRSSAALVVLRQARTLQHSNELPKPRPPIEPSNRPPPSALRRRFPSFPPPTDIGSRPPTGHMQVGSQQAGLRQGTVRPPGQPGSPSANQPGGGLAHPGFVGFCTRRPGQRSARALCQPHPPPPSLGWLARCFWACDGDVLALPDSLLGFGCCA